nr:uncharacterized protein LOC122271368 [Parasteatoda tepidariorum]
MGKWSIHGTFLLVVMFVGCLPCHSLDIDPEEIPKESELHARQFWMQADKDLKTAVSKIIRKAMPVVMKEIYKKDISTTCLSTLLQFTSALKQSKKWAYLMLDSSGRIPEGFLQGTVTSMGNYDECLAINVNETKLKLRGQYCTIEIHPPLPVWKPFTPLHQTVPELLNISAPDSVITYIATMLHNLHVVSVKLGICTPSPCTREDISHLVQIIPEKLNLKWKFEVKHCEIEQDLQFTKSQLIVLYVVGIVFLLLIVGTAVDIMYPSEKMEKKGYRWMTFKENTILDLFNIKNISEPMHGNKIQVNNVK